MRRSREDGAAAVEFALIVPLLVLFILAIIEGGTRYSQQSEVNHWAFLAARDLSIDPAKDAQDVIDELSGEPGTYQAAVASAACPSVQIVVTTERDSPTGMFGSYRLTGEGTARCEG